MNGRSLLGPAGALGPHLSCSHSAGQTGTQLSTRILPIHLSHLPIKCTVSSATGAQPAAENPPAITPSLGGRLGRLRGAQPPPSASSRRVGRPGHGFGGGFGGALAGLVPYLPVHVAEHRFGPPQRSLRVGCSFYGYCSARGRAFGWMLGLAGPASPSGSARNLTGSRCVRERRSRTKRGGKAEEENSARAGYRGCPQQVSLRTGFRKE